jgi:hypothetical protein
MSKSQTRAIVRDQNVTVHFTTHTHSHTAERLTNIAPVETQILNACGLRGSKYSGTLCRRGTDHPTYIALVTTQVQPHA